MTYRDLDIRLLRELQIDARRSNRQLAEALGVAASTVGARIRDLEKRGAIRGYRALLDYGELGLGLVAVTRIKARGDALPIIVKSLTEHPSLTHVYEITGRIRRSRDRPVRQRDRDEPGDQEHARPAGDRGNEHLRRAGRPEGVARRGVPDGVSREVAERDLHQPASGSRCARGPGHQLPALSPTRRVARGSRPDEARGLRRRGLLGSARLRVRRPGRLAADRGSRSRSARRESDRTHVHRRSFRGLAVRFAA